MHAGRAGPWVPLYCSAWTPFSARTLAVAFSMASTGKDTGLGRPPAKEIRSGEAAAARMLAVNSPWKSGRMIFSDMCTVISNSS